MQTKHGQSCNSYLYFSFHCLVQLREIRKFTLARLICDNLDNIYEIQKFVMLQPISEAFRLLG